MQNIDLTLAKTASDYIKEQFQIKDAPSAAVILGSGLGGFVSVVSIIKSIDYRDIPGFPESHVIGHKGRLSIAMLENGSQILIMEGRFHYYDGFTPYQITLPVMVFHLLGIKVLIVSNAAGGINSSFKVGDLMIMNDHINFTGNNPLIGQNNDKLGPRFLDQTNPYDINLINLAKELAVDCDINPKIGSYLMLSGPAYETKAEIRAFSFMGIDAVGMSTVYEVMMANYLGMKVLGISSITNMATGLVTGHSHDHNAVLDISKQITHKFALWVKLILERLPICTS